MPAGLTSADVNKVHCAVGPRSHQALRGARQGAVLQQGAGQQGRVQPEVLQAAALPHILQGCMVAGGRAQGPVGSA